MSKRFGILTLMLIAGLAAYSQVPNTGPVDRITDRQRPAEWSNLVPGGRFIDLFLPMPLNSPLTKNTWGALNVIPRDINNGIEDRKYSIWGGNIIPGDDGKYHMLVCGWLESSPRGHATWRNSIVFHAISDNMSGPFKIRDTIGPGHNPEVYRLNDGRYVLYVINAYYVADKITGPWISGKFEFLNRDRRIIDGLSNLTFAKREDGSFLMVNRGGGIWFSQTGLSPYNQVTESRVYPAVEGAFEDPVVWRDNIQYNLIVNDWMGRIAYYLRSKDGVKWKIEPGEAYTPQISRRADGSSEEWFKYERMKVFQDKYGRAIQANFAVIDTMKNEDKGSDNHSSKNICIPLTVPRLLTIVSKRTITPATRKINVRIAAEPGFNPQTDVDIISLRFGSSDEVNYGRGCKVIKTKKSGTDLVVTFDGSSSGIKEDDYAFKMLGKTNNGELLFGWAHLPGVNIKEPILSACLPKISQQGEGFKLDVEVQNFGQVGSKPASLKIVFKRDGNQTEIASGSIPVLNPFGKANIVLNCGNIFEKGVSYDMVVIINPESKKPVMLDGKLIPFS